MLLCKRLKEGCARDISLEDLQDDIHIVGFHLEYCLPEPLHEVFERLVLLQLDVLQGAYVLFLASKK